MSVSVQQALAAVEAAGRDGRLRAVCDAHGIELVTLFGSALHGSDPKDLDVALGFRHDVPYDLLAAINALADLVPGDVLDIMDLNRAGPVARVEALVGSRVLHESAPGVFTRRELHALGEYIDTAHLRDALLRELAR
ncbi:MAG: hypothetical protein Q4G43_05250 [Mobilicoccus sp.]|nr:hypothetical protein [Mobilicoccus sp.]